jgi:hypothetical protein
MSIFKDKLENLLSNYKIKKIKPVSNPDISSVLDTLGPCPNDFKEFYEVTNGLSYGWFKIFPIEDKLNIKKTWDSIQKANDSQNSIYRDGTYELFERFIIFGVIGGGNVALIDRTDFSIWFEEDDLHQTDFTLYEFIETTLREVKEL